MRSTRLLLATAAASAVLVIAAPGAQAGESDWDHEGGSSYSKEHDKEGKEGKDDAPRGGMHTGGGALTAVNEEEWGTAKDPKHDPETYKDDNASETAKDPKHDPETYKDQNASETDKESGYQKDSYGDKPSGGMHTGGGALASPGLTAGGVAVLAVAATGLYAARRRSVGNAA